MASFTAHTNTDISRGEVAIGNSATIDRVRTPEPRNGAHEQLAKVETEQIQQKNAISLGSLAPDSPLADPIVNSLGEPAAAHTAMLDTSPMATTARHTVINTPELLEAIICVLPAREILTKAQMVSQTWKNTIAQSPSIQTRLWLRPQASKAISPTDHSVHFPIGEYLSEPPRYNDILPKHEPVYCGSVAHNDLFHLYPAVVVFYDKALTLRKRACVRNGQAFFDTMLINTDKLEQTLSTVQHTWLNMYLTEPPTTSVQLHVGKPIPRVQRLQPTHVHVSQVSIREPGGLTFGRIVEVLDRIFASASDPVKSRLEAHVSMHFVTEG